MLWLVDRVHRYLPFLVAGIEKRSKGIVQGCFKEGLLEVWLVLAHGTTFDFPVFLSHGPEPLDMGKSMTRITTVTITAALRIVVWVMGKRCCGVR